jgi:hypothetical protein
MVQTRRLIGRRTLTHAGSMWLELPPLAALGDRVRSDSGVYSTSVFSDNDPRRLWRAVCRSANNESPSIAPKVMFIRSLLNGPQFDSFGILQ